MGSLDDARWQWGSDTDVTHLVLEHLHATCPEILIALSLVSKNFYFVCTRWLYRNITINFANAPGRALLRRISRPASRISGFVRSVELQKCDEADWGLLDNSLKQFRRLAKLTWDHQANLPEAILNTLARRHPKAELQANVSQMYDSRPTDHGVSILFTTIFVYPGLDQLTSFDFHTTESNFFYPNLKTDLVNLLTRSKTLRHLRVYRGPLERAIHEECPEMAQAFQVRLPVLESLVLATRYHLFTYNELAAWGIDGWPRLRYLNLSRPSDLITFFGKVSQLVILDLTADFGDGMDELASRLAEYTGSSPPLGPVRHLMYTHYIPHSARPNSPRLSHVIPWCVIKKVSTTLIDYTTHNSPLYVFRPGYAAASTADVVRLSTMCPGLETLRLDVRVEGMSWDGEHLAIFARFPKLKALMLYVHQIMDSYDPGLAFIPGSENTAIFFKEAYRHIAKAAREHKPDSLVFSVAFKLVEDFDHESFERHSGLDPDFEASRNGALTPYERPAVGNKQLTLRQQYARLETGALRVKAKLMMEETMNEGGIAAPAPDELNLILTELERRERLEERYGDSSVTLYDMWMEESERSKQLVAEG